MTADLFAGVRVADFEAAVAWYERLLGGPPSFRAHDTEVVWEVAASIEHRAGDSLQLHAGGRRVAGEDGLHPPLADQRLQAVHHAKPLPRG